VETTVDLGGVRTWYAVDGAGDPLVYLHGGFSDADELDPVRAQYAARFRVFSPDRRGHGRTPDVEGPIDFEGQRVLRHRTPREARPADVSGPSATTDTITLDDAVAGMLQTPLAERYGQLSPDGAGHFPVVAEKVMRSTFEEPRLDVDELRQVQARTLVVSADDDVIALEHTLEIYRTIPDAELAVVPGTSHVLILEKPELVARLVLDFLTGDPVPTRVPIRRR
jgi:pimeloyl-ACP methyl ester carboxylesterase